MSTYQVKSFRGGISEYEDKGIPGSFKFAVNADIRRSNDSLSAGQALIDEGINAGSTSASPSPSASTSPSGSPSTTASPSASVSPSSSPSKSPSPSTGESDSPSLSASLSASPSASVSPSTSISASPSPSSGLESVFEDLIKVFVESKDGYTYGFGNAGCIYRRDSDGFWMRLYKDPDGAIKGASEWYDDAGKLWLVWATDTLLKKKEIPGQLNWNDVITVGNLVSSEWHTMREAGGALMICNKEFVAYLGYDGSFTPEAVDLIPGNIAKTIVERDGRAVFGTVRASDTSRGVNGAIDSEVPLAQVGTDGEVFYANMIDSIPVLRFPGGGKVNPHGVTNLVDQVNFFEYEEGASSWTDKQSVGNLSLWGVYGATSGYNGVYSLGRKKKNQPFVLNLEYGLEVDEIGAIVNVSGTMLISYQDGTDYGVKASDPNNKAILTYYGLDFKSPIKKPGHITNWKMAHLMFAPLPNGTSIEFWYRVDKSGNFVRARVDDGQNSFSTANKQEAVFLIGANGKIFEHKIIANPYGNQAPEIYEENVHFI